MKSLLTDPVVLACSGVIVVGIFGLLWAIAKFRKVGAPPVDDLPVFQDELLSASAPAPVISDIPLRAAPTLTPSPSAGPAVSREVAERLESMTQRLAEMQTVLMKQSSAGPAAGGVPAGGMGQGFSPETIEKLLKIVGNVIQQVDILQKSLNTTK